MIKDDVFCQMLYISWLKRSKKWTMRSSGSDIEVTTELDNQYPSLRRKFHCKKSVWAHILSSAFQDF